jgi:hypothetical protein
VVLVWLALLTIAMTTTCVAFVCLRWVVRRRPKAPQLPLPRRSANRRSRGVGPARTPPRRPIEQVARDLRRLGRQFRNPLPGTSYVKVQAARYAYDRALAEAGDALGVDHLMRVLEPGHELDAERDRLEAKLWLAGLHIDDPD